MTDAKNVTERETYIIAQALYEFIRLEQSKPLDKRRQSDVQDAKALCTRGSTTNWRCWCSLTKPLAVSLPTVGGQRQ